MPTLFTLAAVALVCAGLGAWQVERLQWKRGLIAEREAALRRSAGAAAARPRRGGGDRNSAG